MFDMNTSWFKEMNTLLWLSTCLYSSLIFLLPLYAHGFCTAVYGLECWKSHGDVNCNHVQLIVYVKHMRCIKLYYKSQPFNFSLIFCGNDPTATIITTFGFFIENKYTG